MSYLSNQMLRLFRLLRDGSTYKHPDKCNIFYTNLNPTKAMTKQECHPQKQSVVPEQIGRLLKKLILGIIYLLLWLHRGAQLIALI